MTTPQRPDFIEKLRKLMHEKRLSQSALARKIWGEIEDPRGYKVARNRDRISSWLAGKSTPDLENLNKLAVVLDVSPDELLPHTEPLPGSHAQYGPPEITITSVAGTSPGTVLLQVNKMVPMPVALKVASLLEPGAGAGNSG